MEQSTTKPFPTTSHNYSEKILGLVFTDICGPYGLSSKGGNLYMITFTDCCSKYTWIYFLKHKSESVDKLKYFILDTSSLLKTKVHTIRSDSGGEYISSDWINHCHQNNITIQYSSTYSPQQNGMAERMNRTLNDIARTMLIGSGLSPSFWAESLKCAAYIRNRIPTGFHRDKKTPFQK